MSNERPAFTNNLTPAEAERLAMLAEEMGEAQQIIGKILRHGYESYNPDLVRNQMSNVPKYTNREMLEKELGDVSAIINLMAMGGDIEREEVQRHSIQKMKGINRWLHHFTVNVPKEN